MKKRQILEIQDEIRRMSIKKYNVLLNFLRWLNYSDDALSNKEIEGISKGRKEKGGIFWSHLRQNV